MEIAQADNELSRRIIGAAIEVHKFFGGPGLLESVYEKALEEELSLRGIACERQVECPIVYKNKELKDPFKIDLLVEGRIIVECKATAENDPVFAAQCLTYLRMKNLRLGLVINFGLPVLKDGIKRVVNPYIIP
ncbi:MAG: GxxExxY protein [Opitutales bacterium]|nr:GxxExxY protein [Opitutales bacterium]